jgi:FKBP-type peptidyl-prolyl cis-trans isomerase
MILRCSKIFFLPILLAVFLLNSCVRGSKNNGFSGHKLGYRWQLLAFEESKSNKTKGAIAWLNATFSTQKDSVFYDSKHDLRDRFFIRPDSIQQNNYLAHLLARCDEGDSLCMLVKPKDFFSQQFRSNLPFFSEKDTVVKVNFRIKKIMGTDEFDKLSKKISKDEMKEIEAYFGSAEAFEKARDTRGFYWVERNEMAGDSIRYGDAISINYQGSFLNGRTIDISPKGFQFIYGTPDQLIKGLNYAIGRMKRGQNSKIILPSHLAFGENGSSNGSIPPFTPMLYRITVTDIKN